MERVSNDREGDDTNKQHNDVDLIVLVDLLEGLGVAEVLLAAHPAVVREVAAIAAVDRIVWREEEFAVVAASSDGVSFAFPLPRHEAHPVSLAGFRVVAVAAMASGGS